MLKAIGYLAGTPTIALAGGYLIYAVWDTLIRQELVPNSTFTWFPVAAVLWVCFCLGVGLLLYRRHSAQLTDGQENRPTSEVR